EGALRGALRARPPPALGRVAARSGLRDARRHGAAVTPGPAPASTYRLQVSPRFTLDDAAATADYIRSLGADWLYLSPLLASHEGSDHGYDVVDHSLVDPTRGGSDGLDRMSAAARELGLGVLVDIVPNHVGVETALANPWWCDVLRHGPSSRYAE